ncbi:MAG: hypothetical protein QM692_11545 [Thermomicrobiales bacterium]
MTANDRLAIYLNDHLAGSVIALEMLEDLQDDPDLTELRRDILADRELLEHLIARTGADLSKPRQAAAWLTEKAGDLKLLLDDPDQGALRRLEMLETVAMGIDGKAALWATLRQIQPTHALLLPEDFTALQQRAARQRARIETHRLAAAQAAFAG